MRKILKPRMSTDITLFSAAKERKERNVGEE